MPVQTYRATLISRSKDGEHAQIVVHFMENGEKRSRTLHVRVSSKTIKSPHYEKNIKKHREAEGALAEARRVRDKAERTLKELTSQLESAHELFDLAAKERTLLAEAEEKHETAKAVFEAALTNLKNTQEDYPLEADYIF